MFSKLTIEEKRQHVLQLQIERSKLKAGAKAAKTRSSSSGSRTKKQMPAFENQEVKAIFEKLPAEFQQYLQKGR